MALIPGSDGNTLTATETFTDAGNVFSSATATGGTSAAIKTDETLKAEADRYRARVASLLAPADAELGA